MARASVECSPLGVRSCWWQRPKPLSPGFCETRLLCVAIRASQRCQRPVRTRAGQALASLALDIGHVDLNRRVVLQHLQ